MAAAAAEGAEGAESLQQPEGGVCMGLRRRVHGGRGSGGSGIPTTARDCLGGCMGGGTEWAGAGSLQQQETAWVGAWGEGAGVGWGGITDGPQTVMNQEISWYE